jgi:hypothetical protein
MFRQFLLLLVLPTALLGCGTSVEPTGDFKDPASIPVCCVSSFSEVCCGLDAFAGFNGVQLSWNSEDEVFTFIDGWILYRAEGESEPEDGDYERLNPDLILERTFLDIVVEEGRTYWYRLVSITPAGVQSTPTTAIWVRPDFEPPEVPSGLSAVADSSQVFLRWDASTAPDFDHFNVLRDPEFPPTVFFTVRIPRFFDDSVERGVTYTYRVTSVDIGVNESSPSDSVVVTVP